jgi:hypothetical protein
MTVPLDVVAAFLPDVDDTDVTVAPGDAGLPRFAP